jgi:hypothetical protein
MSAAPVDAAAGPPPESFVRELIQKEHEYVLRCEERASRVAEISFAIDDDGSDDGRTPAVNLGDRRMALWQMFILDDADEVVIPPGPAVDIVVEYPAEQPLRVPIEPGQNGLVRTALFRAIVDAYFRMYEEEDRTSTAPVERMCDRFPEVCPQLRNRAPTDGTHKLWGHFLSDLFLTGAFFDADKREVYPAVDA